MKDRIQNLINHYHFKIERLDGILDEMQKEYFTKCELRSLMETEQYYKDKAIHTMEQSCYKEFIRELKNLP